MTEVERQLSMQDALTSLPTATAATGDEQQAAADNHQEQEEVKQQQQPLSSPSGAALDENSNSTVIYSYDDAAARHHTSATTTTTTTTPAAAAGGNRKPQSRGADPLLCGEENSSSSSSGNGGGSISDGGLFPAHLLEKNLFHISDHAAADYELCDFDNDDDLRGGGIDTSPRGKQAADDDEDDMLRRLGMFMSGDDADAGILTGENVFDDCGLPASFPSPVHNETIVNGPHQLEPGELFPNRTFYSEPFGNSAFPFHADSSGSDQPAIDDEEGYHSPGEVRPLAATVCDKLPETCQSDGDTPLDFSLPSASSSSAALRERLVQITIDKIKRDLVMKSKSSRGVSFGRGRPSTQVINKAFSMWFLPSIVLNRCDNMQAIVEDSRRDEIPKPDRPGKSYLNGSSIARIMSQKKGKSRGSSSDSTWKKTLSKLFKYKKKNNSNSHGRRRSRGQKGKTSSLNNRTVGASRAKNPTSPAEKGQAEHSCGASGDSPRPRYKPGPLSSHKRRQKGNSTNIAHPGVIQQDRASGRSSRIKQVSTPTADYVIEYTNDEEDELPDLESGEGEMMGEDLGVVVKQEPIDDCEGHVLTDVDALSVCDSVKSDIKIENIRSIDPYVFNTESKDEKVRHDGHTIRDTMEHILDTVSQNVGNTNETDDVSSCDVFDTSDPNLCGAAYVHKKFGMNKKSTDDSGSSNDESSPSAKSMLSECSMDNNLAIYEADDGAKQKNNSADLKKREKQESGKRKNSRVKKVLKGPSNDSETDPELTKLTAARLSQEFKTFNWLENKILSGSMENNITSNLNDKNEAKEHGDHEHSEKPIENVSFRPNFYVESKPDKPSSLKASELNYYDRTPTGNDCEKPSMTDINKDMGKKDESKQAIINTRGESIELQSDKRCAPGNSCDKAEHISRMGEQLFPNYKTTENDGESGKLPKRPTVYKHIAPKRINMRDIVEKIIETSTNKALMEGGNETGPDGFMAMPTQNVSTGERGKAGRESLVFESSASVSKANVSSVNDPVINGTPVIPNICAPRTEQQDTSKESPPLPPCPPLTHVSSMMQVSMAMLNTSLLSQCKTAPPLQQSVATIHPITSTSASSKQYTTASAVLNNVSLQSVQKQSAHQNPQKVAHTSTYAFQSLSQQSNSKSHTVHHHQASSSAAHTHSSQTPTKTTLPDIENEVLPDYNNLDDRTAMLKLQDKFSNYKKHLRSLYELSYQKQRERDVIHLKIQKVLQNLKHVRDMCKVRFVNKSKSRLSGASGANKRPSTATIDLTMSPPAAKKQSFDTVTGVLGRMSTQSAKSPTAQVSPTDLSTSTGKTSEGEALDMRMNHTLTPVGPSTHHRKSDAAGGQAAPRAHSRQTAFAVHVSNAPVRAHENKKDLTHFTHLKCVHTGAKARTEDTGARQRKPQDGVLDLAKLSFHSAPNPPQRSNQPLKSVLEHPAPTHPSVVKPKPIRPPSNGVGEFQSHKPNVNHHRQQNTTNMPSTIAQALSASRNKTLPKHVATDPEPYPYLDKMSPKGTPASEAKGHKTVVVPPSPRQMAFPVPVSSSQMTVQSYTASMPQGVHPETASMHGVSRSNIPNRTDSNMSGSVFVNRNLKTKVKNAMPYHPNKMHQMPMSKNENESHMMQAMARIRMPDSGVIPNPADNRTQMQQQQMANYYINQAQNTMKVPTAPPQQKQPTSVPCSTFPISYQGMQSQSWMNPLERMTQQVQSSTHHHPPAMQANYTPRSLFQNVVHQQRPQTQYHMMFNRNLMQRPPLNSNMFLQNTNEMSQDFR